MLREENSKTTKGNKGEGKIGWWLFVYQPYLSVSHPSHYSVFRSACWGPFVDRKYMGRDIVGLKYMAKAPNYISLRPIISHQQKPHNHPFSPCLFSPFIFWQGWARWLNIQNIKGAAWRYKGLYGARWLIFWPATVVLIRSSFRCTTHVPLRLSLYHSAQKEKGGNQRHDSFRQTMYR